MKSSIFSFVSFVILICHGLFSVNAQTLIRESFGVTSHLDWVPLDKMDKIKVARTYTSAGTFCHDPEEYMFEPTWQNFHYDNYLQDGKNRGMKFVICLTNNLPFFAGGSTENEDHPVPPGANKEDPASYVLYGKLVFQITARYGRKVVADSLLKVKNFPVGDYRYQTKRSGTGLVYGIEIWNEANKWGGNFTPKEYYALLSACYDGHKGTLGIDVGAMQADPDMNFFFTGTSDQTPAYNQAVRDIWVQERGEPFPENIIYNFHGYFHNKAINNNNRTTGIAPEFAGALPLYRQWAAFAGNNRFAKTEYGYDTNPASIQHAPLLSKPDTGTYSIQESQAALILRDYHLQSVIPQMFLSIFYHVRDRNDGGSSLQYSTSGITLGACCNYTPKESYYIITGFIELSDGFFSNGTLVREDPYIVRYENGQGKYLYALWSYAFASYPIDKVITSDDTLMMIIPTKTGNFYDTIIPVSDSFSVVANQIPFYILTDSPVEFHVPVCDGPVANLSICSGDSVLIYGAYRKSYGTYYDTLMGAKCDSIFTTHLTVNGGSQLQEISICQGESFFAGGDSQTVSGIYYDTLLSLSGCDSILITHLLVNPCNQIIISGAIFTENEIPIPGVSVILSGLESDTVITDSDGLYSFEVGEGGDYIITPSKSNDSVITNGITSIDLVLMQKHILAVDTLDSPYKIIAADVNATNSVTTSDIGLVKGIILGISTAFPNGKLWLFVKSDFIFNDPINPFLFERSRTYDNINANQTNQNFIGMKLGDVNGSWNPTIP